MKLNTPKEIADKKQAETAKDILRTESAKKALDTVTDELNQSEARFNLSLANQRVRWAREEQEAVDRLKAIEEKIKSEETKLKSMLVPIEEREKKSYALFTEAEKVLAEANLKIQDLESKETEIDQMANLLEEKLDDLHDKEIDMDERGSRLIVREKAVEEERALIKSLSAELSIKLSNI